MLCHLDVRQDELREKKAMEKLIEDLEREDLVDSTHSDWTAQSLLVPKKMKPIAWL